MSPTEQDLREALELVQIFYATRRTKDYRVRWQALTGSSEFTIRALAAHIDNVLARKEP
jgi:hypothetical protein